jgi:hypothetical protein
MQFRSSFNLRSQVGRSAKEKPRASVLADGNLGLAAGLALKVAGSYRATVRASAIPLWKRTPGG